MLPGCGVFCLSFWFPRIQRLSQKLIIHIPQHAELDKLPAFEGITCERIVTPATPDDFRAAVNEIAAFSCIGFDTESKPTFKVGEVSSGPHLIQFATPDKAYLFQVFAPGCIEAARIVLQARDIVKIGFGLKSDRSRLRSRLDIQANQLLDLGSTLRYQGKKGQVGLRGAVAGVLNARVSKSRSVATSNWARATLTEAQQSYAANDAYAALRVFLGLPAEQQQMLLGEGRN
ncbi:3'-5' exonuclease [Stutzerimonas stutzeri]|uniref:3'-5' exonuclease n=1 Tax=Stutzerimonas stutzeri TaxID=316 RepID=A0A2S4AUK7_STUST|nr:3'-5' exonuclease [Stutzerimonas stutzeri]